MIKDKEVKLGDWVGFKCDIEQYGKVIDINSDVFGDEVKLENLNGFDGHYIGGDTVTWIDADRCWPE